MRTASNVLAPSTAAPAEESNPTSDLDENQVLTVSIKDFDNRVAALTAEGKATYEIAKELDVSKFKVQRSKSRQGLTAKKDKNPMRGMLAQAIEFTDAWEGALVHRDELISRASADQRHELAAQLEQLRNTVGEVIRRVKAPKAAASAEKPAGFWTNLQSAFANVGKERPWFAEGAIEGTPIIMFSGPEKSCKSWTAMQLAVATAIGGQWLGRFPIRRRGPVAYLDGEYGEHEFARRVARIARAMGADPRDVFGSLRYRYSVDLTLVRNDSTFRQALAEVRREPPALIVLDPLRNHLDGSENDADAIVRAYKCLNELRDVAHCPVLVLHHLNKSGGFSGSRAITTRADLIIEGSDDEAPSYKTRGRTVRPTIDPIAVEFTIDVQHEHDEDDTIAKAHVQYAPVGGSNTPEGLSALGKKIVQLLDKQSELRTVGYIAKAVDRNSTATRDGLEELFEAKLADYVADGVCYNGKTFDGWARWGAPCLEVSL